MLTPMSHVTRATQVLKVHAVAFTLHSYDYDPNADRIGMAAAEALGQPLNAQERCAGFRHHAAG